jgi:phosphatidylserine/phosphatidylglycerophosphate/cardiolipin synthase-like enzyme
MTDASLKPSESLDVTFLSEGGQTARDIATRLAGFIQAAQRSLDFAIYDFRLSAEPAAIVVEALRERAAAGVAIRIAYDADKPTQPHLMRGMDPAPPGTGEFVRSLGYPWRRIGGLNLMHQKYIVRDVDLPTAGVWTGSTNFTDDSWTLQENNILQIPSAPLARAYTQDFADLWRNGEIEGSGDGRTETLPITYAGTAATVRAAFAPRCGPEIDDEVAQRVASAQRRVRICSMLVNSGALLAALGDLLRAGQLEIGGVYDRTQMLSVLIQWQEVPHNRWKISAVEDIVRRARLIGKNSTPYSPTGRHDFMHCKVLVVDDMVITGSYNFSHSAEQNAENILMIENPALAEDYVRFIDSVMRRYATGPQGLALPSNGGKSYGGPRI